MSVEDYELPCEIIQKIVEFLDDIKTFLSLSSVSREFLNAVKDMRLSIIINKIFTKSKLSLEHIETREPVEIVMDILKDPLQIYGSLYAIKVFNQFNIIAKQPLMLNPQFISSVRNNRPTWEIITKKHAGIFGYIMEFDNKWYTWYHNKLSHPNELEGIMKLLKQLLAINYLATYFIDQQTLLREVTKQGPIILVDQLIFELKDNNVVYYKKTMNSLVDEICMNLPLTKYLHKYTNMREMQYYLTEAAFKDLQSEGLVCSDAPNPLNGGYCSWTLSAKENKK